MTIKYCSTKFGKNPKNWICTHNALPSFTIISIILWSWERERESQSVGPMNIHEQPNVTKRQPHYPSCNNNNQSTITMFFCFIAIVYCGNKRSVNTKEKQKTTKTLKNLVHICPSGLTLKQLCSQTVMPSILKVFSIVPAIPVKQQENGHQFVDVKWEFVSSAGCTFFLVCWHSPSISSRGYCNLPCKGTDTSSKPMNLCVHCLHSPPILLLVRPDHQTWFGTPHSATTTCCGRAADTPLRYNSMLN